MSTSTNLSIYQRATGKFSIAGLSREVAAEAKWIGLQFEFVESAERAIAKIEAARRA